MNANKFNEIFDAYSQMHLVPMGFKKKGTSYYLIDKENIFNFKKGTFQGVFTGFIFCYSYLFLDNFKDEKGKLKIAPYAEDYLITIDCSDLNALSKKYKNIADFKYEFNFSKRGMNFLSFQNETFDLNNLNVHATNQTINEKYIENSVLQAKELGVKYLKQLNPQITLKLLKESKNKIDNEILKKLVAYNTNYS
ncbi:MAG TPA: hypothetical protein PK431_12435 [Chitinophagales bacterium]|nr:hypothetical protein [Chitinophagales bacterium]